MFAVNMLVSVTVPVITRGINIAKYCKCWCVWDTSLGFTSKNYQQAWDFKGQLGTLLCHKYGTNESTGNSS